MQHPVSDCATLFGQVCFAGAGWNHPQCVMCARPHTPGCGRIFIKLQSGACVWCRVWLYIKSQLINHAMQHVCCLTAQIANLFKCCVVCSFTVPKVKPDTNLSWIVHKLLAIQHHVDGFLRGRGIWAGTGTILAEICRP